jgi:N-methylhydantoinase B
LRNAESGAREASPSTAPLTLEIFRHALTGIADEMSVALRRAAYSTNIKTRLDFSCSLLDGRARTIAQSFTQPIHLGTIARFVPNILEAFGGAADLRPGDAIICNDSHLGGLHLNDVCLVAPLIVDG